MQSHLKRPGADTAPVVDERRFRDALGRFVTGVTVVTTVDGAGGLHGLTVSSFASVSLDPPLVLFCLGNRSKSLEAFSTAKGFAVSVLGASQQPLAETFAAGARPWEALSLEVWETGAPLIDGAIAKIDCRREAVHHGGDHVILVGRVLRLATSEHEPPLARFRGRYTGIDKDG